MWLLSRFSELCNNKIKMCAWPFRRQKQQMLFIRLPQVKLTMHMWLLLVIAELITKLNDS